VIAKSAELNDDVNTSCRRYLMMKITSPGGAPGCQGQWYGKKIHPTHYMISFSSQGYCLAFFGSRVDLEFHPLLLLDNFASFTFFAPETFQPSTK
jgi:hypothetical protein